MKSRYAVVTATLTLFLAAETHLLLVLLLPSRAIQVLGLPMLGLVGMAAWECLRKTQRPAMRMAVVSLLALAGVASGLYIWSSAGLSPVVPASSHSVGRQFIDPAESTLRRMVREKPHDLESRYQLARLLEKEGRSQEAVVEYQRLLNITDQEPDVHFAYAVLLMKVGKHSEAQVHLQEALKLYPADSPWREEVRRTLSRLRDRGGS